jgi:hypothetical protein
MRDSYMEREVPTDVEEDHNDVNKANILGFTDDDIEFHVHNIEEMVRVAKYKKMIEDSKKPFYHGCATQYMRLFVMVKLFQLKVSNGWSDCSFKDLLMILKDMLPQGNVVTETVYEAKLIICPLGLEVEKNPRMQE